MITSSCERAQSHDVYAKASNHCFGSLSSRNKLDALMTFPMDNINSKHKIFFAEMCYQSIWSQAATISNTLLHDLSHN